MKILTVLTKIFGTQNIVDYIHHKDEEDTFTEFYALYSNGNDCEPELFIRIYNDKFVLSDINSKILCTGELNNKLIKVSVLNAVKQLGIVLPE